MKLSKRQEDELVVWEYFMPKNCKWEEKTDEQVQKFFEWSQAGKHKDLAAKGGLSYFIGLVEGKRWAYIHAHELYEPGILDGTMPYITILGLFDGPKRKWWQFWKPKWANNVPPRQVVDFLKKEMFKGHDAEIIERCYQELLR